MLPAYRARPRVAIFLLALLLALLGLSALLPAAPPTGARAPQAGSPTPTPTMSGTPVPVRTGVAGPVREVRLPTPSATLPALSAERRARIATVMGERPRPPAPPDEPGAPRSARPPHLPETRVESRVAPAAVAEAADLALFTNVPVVPAVPSDYLSVVNEPSLAHAGSTVFYTGNWYAALSTDAGATFGFIDPYTALPFAAGGFCCDQVTIYDPSRDITVWVLQYVRDAQGNNVQRVAVAKGQSGLTNRVWQYFDLNAQMFGLPDSRWLDYPHLALSDNDLYLTTNVFQGTGSYVTSLAVRFELDALASLVTGATPAARYFSSDRGTLTPTAGAGGTMYVATHVTTSTLRVYRWSEENDTPTYVDVSHALFNASNASCPGPDGANMCGRVDGRINTGWVANGVIGFMWGAAQGAGGLGSFTYPYVQVVRIDQTALTLLDEPAIYSSSYAYAYPSVAVNARDHLGLTVAYGGGAYHPSSVVGVRDDLSPTNWAWQTVRTGTHGPGANRWGDYLTVRPASGNGATWVASTFTLQGACEPSSSVPCANVEPRFVWFGRERDNPHPPTPTPTPTATPPGTATPTATPGGPTATPTATPTAPPTFIATPSATPTHTPSPTYTPTPTHTPVGGPGPQPPTPTPTATPVAGLPTIWYFAEGYTGAGFDEYLTIMNPSSIDAQVRITYYLAASRTAVRTLTARANARMTVAVYDPVVGVGRGQEVSARVESTNGVGIVVERPMYFTYGNGITGGHNVLGANAPRTTWYFAEGSTAPGFDQYLTIMNPSDTGAWLRLTYYLGGGEAPVERTVLVPPTSRYTVAVHEAREGVGRGKEVATRVESINGIGVVVERPMYFTYGDGITGGHNVMGAPGPATTWYFAEGFTAISFDEYLTIMNPTETVAQVTITYYTSASSSKTVSLAVNPTSRATVAVYQPELGVGRGWNVSAKVESANGVGIVVERPIYFRYGTDITGGHDVMGANRPREAWYFAEGSTAPDFDEYLTIMNPNAEPAPVTLTYYLANGQTVQRSLTVRAATRETVRVHDIALGVGRGHEVSVKATTSHPGGIVVERPMYFAYGAGIDGGHIVMGFAP